MTLLQKKKGGGGGGGYRDLDDSFQWKAWGADPTLAGVRGSEGLSWQIAEVDQWDDVLMQSRISGSASCVQAGVCVCVCVCFREGWLYLFPRPDRYTPAISCLHVDSAQR